MVMIAAVRSATSPRLRIPARWATKTEIDGNPVDQILIREQYAGVVSNGVDAYSCTLESEQIVKLLAEKAVGNINGLSIVLPDETYVDLAATTDIPSGRWVDGNAAATDPAAVLRSLDGAFQFIEDDPVRGRQGLRSPQLGATHTVLGYWSTKKEEPATVVMPTGTGKTDTMLALFCTGRPERLLVIVPSDALRTQIADKFLSLGVLQEFGVLSPRGLRPVVGQVKHAFSDPATAAAFATRCNVIVATPDALRASDEPTRFALYERCSHLFIDEAYHVEAETWNAIRRRFIGKSVVQFTATPFREDGKRLGGRLVYAFPLREAQRLGYFSTIDYVSVVDFYDQDRAIAAHAIERLRQDRVAGYDHILMARVKWKKRADELLPLYRELGPEFQPMVLYSGIPETDRLARLAAMRSRKSRIVICVDMLGEGFDMPELKIAEIHDPHKSLGVTLQFVGRFSRNVPGRLGNATVVVGRPKGEFDDRLLKLYAQDSDWNLVIRDLSQAAVADEEEVNDFEAAFGELPDEVSIRSLLPKMSTVIYKVTDAEWRPEGIYRVYPPEEVLTDPLPVNDRDGVMWCVIEQRAEVEWGQVNLVENVSYDLYVLYHDRTRHLLYVNSSHDAFHEDVAKAVCGDSAIRITGENVYRVLANVKRMLPTNIGVLDVRNRSRRFSMHVGADVTEGLPAGETQTKTKTNLFAYGYEEGNRVSVGASLKGRVWSYRVAKTLKHWKDWCDTVGAKVTDETISIDALMKNFIRPVVLKERPALVPLAVEWPWEIFANVREEFRVEHDGKAWPIVDADLEIRSHTDAGPIEVRVVTPDWQLDYDIAIEEGAMRFAAVGADAVVRGPRSIASLRDYLSQNGLQIYFEQEALVTPEAILHKPDRNLLPYDPADLIDLDWTGIDLSVESQGGQRRPDSVQAYMIEQVKAMADWTVVLDDDTSNEMADIVALRVEGNELVVHLTHCKYVSDWRQGEDRRRIDDLYDVCGQAMKSVRWRRAVDTFFTNLIRRQKQYLDRNGVTGFMVGDELKLMDLFDRSRLLKPQFTIAIAQPGLQKHNHSDAQLELLAATQTYVYDVANGAFAVYCSH